MHRVCRLVTHESLKRSGPLLPGTHYSDMGQELLMKSLLKEVVARARVQLDYADRFPNEKFPRKEDNDLSISTFPQQESTTSTTLSSTFKRIPKTQYGVFSQGVSNAVEVHESTAALAVYSCSVIGMQIPSEELEVLAKVILAAQNEWSIGRIVMVTLALGKMSAMPINGQLQAALVSQATEKLSEFSAEEISTLLWGLAHARFDPGQDFVTAAMAELSLKVDEIPQVGIFSTMDALALIEWVPPAPKGAKAALKAQMPWLVSKGTTTLRQQEQQQEGIVNGYSRNGSGRRSSAYGGSNQISNQFRVRDLRELQNLARAWEEERRRGLAAFLDEQQSKQVESSGGSSVGSSSSSAIAGRGGKTWEASTLAGNANSSGSGKIGRDATSTSSELFAFREFSLETLAQKALQARTERDTVAKLSQEATRIARELRKAAATTASRGSDGGGAMNKSSSGKSLRVNTAASQREKASKQSKSLETAVKKPGNGKLTVFESDEFLITKLLTGSYPPETEAPVVNNYNDHSLQGTLLEASLSTSGEQRMITSESGFVSQIDVALPSGDSSFLPQNISYLHGSNTTLLGDLDYTNQTRGLGEEVFSSQGDEVTASGDVVSIQQEGGREIIRSGPLLAEARVSKSGRLLIEPHYDLSLLQDNNFLYPQHAEHDVTMDLERQLENNLIITNGAGDGMLGLKEESIGFSDPGVEDFKADFAKELSSLEELLGVPMESTVDRPSPNLDIQLLEQHVDSDGNELGSLIDLSSRQNIVPLEGSIIDNKQILETELIIDENSNSPGDSDSELSTKLSTKLSTSAAIPLEGVPSLSTWTTDRTKKDAAAAALDALSTRCTSILPTLRIDQAVSFSRYFAVLRHVDYNLLTGVRDKLQKVVEDVEAGALPTSVARGYRFAAAILGENNHSTSRSKSPTKNRGLVGSDGSVENDKNDSSGDNIGSINNSFASSSDSGILKRAPLTSVGIADVLWSFASLGAVDLMPRELSHKLMKDALADPDSSVIALTRCCWSLAVLGHLDAATLRTVCTKVDTYLCGKSQESYGHSEQQSAFSTKEETAAGSPEFAVLERPGHIIMLKQLFQAALQVEIVTGEPYHTLLPPSLLDPAAAAWQDRRNFLYTSSLQRQVAACLRTLGLQCELEYCPKGSYVVIDIAVFDPKSDANLAVEVDGPSHYATNMPNHELGAVRLRDSLLRHSGWDVVSIPYYEWMQVHPWERPAYLKYKIGDALEAQGWRRG